MFVTLNCSNLPSSSPWLLLAWKTHRGVTENKEKQEVYHYFGIFPPRLVSLSGILRVSFLVNSFPSGPYIPFTFSNMDVVPEVAPKLEPVRQNPPTSSSKPSINHEGDFYILRLFRSPTYPNTINGAPSHQPQQNLRCVLIFARQKTGIIHIPTPLCWTQNRVMGCGQLCCSDTNLSLLQVSFKFLTCPEQYGSDTFLLSLRLPLEAKFSCIGCKRRPSAP
jgi:hypothetical protein